MFLSYASEDAQAAGRIADALRTAGIEVWFDRNALRGGDEWDRKIRREIKDCALFVPIISANSEARHEGYFRLEWDLADQRSHMIARGRPFLVPVGLDETRAEDAGVPDSFQRVQWTRLPGGTTPDEFIERIGQLLSDSRAREQGATVVHAAPGVASPPPRAAPDSPPSHPLVRLPCAIRGSPGEQLAPSLWWRWSVLGTSPWVIGTCLLRRCGSRRRPGRAQRRRPPSLRIPLRCCRFRI